MIWFVIGITAGLGIAGFWALWRFILDMDALDRKARRTAFGLEDDQKP